MLLTYHQKLLFPPTKFATITGGIDPSTVLYNELRTVVLAKIEEGRRQLGQDLIVKTDEGEIANEGNTPTMQLFKKVCTYALHWDYKSTVLMILARKHATRSAIARKIYEKRHERIS